MLQEMKMQTVKIIFFIISCIGFYSYTIRKNNIKKEFIPIILISIITIIEFLAGILNFMKITTIVLGIIGVLLAIHEVYHIVKNKEKIKFDFNSILFLMLSCIFAYLLEGAKLTHYDNFSHWGMIIKEMLLNNRLPNFISETIMFTSYPPGTACFVYYVCKYIGNSEGRMLFAQSILILSSIYTIFALCKKEKKINWLICTLSVVYLLLGNIFINQLLVDTVLPVMGIAALVIIDFYKKDSKKALVYSIPILSLLMLVKNSGIFFVIIDLAIWFIYFIKNNGVKEVLKTKYILIILIPILLQCIWNGHTGLVFEQANNAKHSMSISNYTSNLKEKNMEDVEYIFKQFIKEMISIRNKENISMLALMVGFIIMFAISNKDKMLRKNILYWFGIFVISYIVYQISLFGMYIFSMPISEAKNLACYIRYYRTIVMFEYGIFLITTLNFINNYKLNQKIKSVLINMIIIAIIGLLIVFSPNKIEMLYKRDTSTLPIRYEIADIKNQNNIEEQKSYLVYVSDDESFTLDYIFYVCEYEFRSANVRVIKSISELEDKNQMFDYDYFIILRKSDETNQILEEIGGNLEQNVVRIREKDYNIDSST